MILHVELNRYQVVEPCCASSGFHILAQRGEGHSIWQFLQGILNKREENKSKKKWEKRKKWDVGFSYTHSESTYMILPASKAYSYLVFLVGMNDKDATSGWTLILH